MQHILDTCKNNSVEKKNSLSTIGAVALRQSYAKKGKKRKLDLNLTLLIKTFSHTLYKNLLLPLFIFSPLSPFFFTSLLLSSLLPLLAPFLFYSLFSFFLPPIYLSVCFIAFFSPSGSFIFLIISKTS